MSMPGITLGALDVSLRQAAASYKASCEAVQEHKSLTPGQDG
jgi:hypothetical protein